MRSESAAVRTRRRQRVGAAGALYRLVHVGFPVGARVSSRVAGRIGGVCVRDGVAAVAAVVKVARLVRVRLGPAVGDRPRCVARVGVGARRPVNERVAVAGVPCAYPARRLMVRAAAAAAVAMVARSALLRRILHTVRRGARVAVSAFGRRRARFQRNGCVAVSGRPCACSAVRRREAVAVAVLACAAVGVLARRARPRPCRRQADHQAASLSARRLGSRPGSRDCEARSSPGRKSACPRHRRSLRSRSCATASRSARACTASRTPAACGRCSKWNGEPRRPHTSSCAPQSASQRAATAPPPPLVQRSVSEGVGSIARQAARVRGGLVAEE